MRWETIAEFSFIGGVIIATLIGTLPNMTQQAYTLLILLGCVVGFVNIFDKEIERFMRALVAILVSAIAFYVLTAFSQDSMLIFFKNLSLAVALFVAPIAFIVSIIDVYEIAMNYMDDKKKEGKAKKRK